VVLSLLLAFDLVAWGTLALAVATASLAVAAFLQLRQTRAASVEATKTRADSRGPRVSVVAMRPFWPPFQPAQFLDGEDQPWPIGNEFDVPAHQIRIKGLGFVINDGDAVTVEVSDGIRFNPSIEAEFGGIEATGQAEYLAGSRYVVRARTTVRFEYLVTKAVSEWIRAYETPHEPSGTFFLVANDQLATGVEDTFTIDVFGYPIQPISESLGRWGVPRTQLEGAEHDHVEVRPAVRRYRDGSL
jgi:hypothetical protein